MNFSTPVDFGHRGAVVWVEEDMATPYQESRQAAEDQILKVDQVERAVVVSDVATVRAQKAAVYAELAKAAALREVGLALADAVKALASAVQRRG